MQDIIVYAIVAIAALYVVLRFAPGLIKNRLASGSSALLRKSGVSERQAIQVEQRLRDLGQCSSCGSCAGCGKAADKGASSDASPAEARR